MNDARFKFVVESEKVLYDPQQRLKEVKGRSKSSGTETDSEKSYQVQYTKEELVDYAVNINCNLSWLFYTILANTIGYYTLTYSLVFSTNIGKNQFVNILVMLCDAVLFVDAVAIILQYAQKKLLVRTPCKRYNTIWFVMLQFICLVSIPLSVLPQFKDNRIVDLVYLTLDVMRFYKVFIYFSLLRDTPLQIKIKNLYRKYLLILAVIIHSGACIWFTLGCKKAKSVCEAERYGKHSYWNTGHYNYLFALGTNSTEIMVKLHHFESYLICTYYVVGGLIGIGFGGASLRNDIEMLFCIATMCLGLLFINGLFLGEFCANRIYTHTYEAKVIYKVLMIENDLIHSHIPQGLKDRIIKHLNEFSVKNNFITNSNLLLILPESVAVDFRLERYWTAITTCKIFDETSDSFKREISNLMSYELYNTGDVLYEVGKEIEVMYFIAQGNIQVLSSEDGESPILALGSGSFIGQMCLLYCVKPRFKVTVASYTVVYMLHKRDFWKAVNFCYKLRQRPLLHRAFQESIKKARQLQTVRQNAPQTKTVRKWKFVESRKILSEFKEHINKKSKQNTNDSLKRTYTLSRSHDKQSFDDIFLNTSWPWVLQPHSQFLKIWNRCNLLVLIYVALYYPYVVGFSPRGNTVKSLITSDAVYVVYILDVIIQVFTAIETKDGISWRVTDILWVRMESTSFILDIAAALPFHWMTLFISMSNTLQYFSLNRLLKLYKVHLLFAMLERSYKKYVRIIKGIKFALYLLYLGYILGTLYYIHSCYEKDCNYNSWSQALKRILVSSPDYTEEHDPMNIIALYAFLYMLYLVTITSECLAVNIEEIAIITLFSLFGMLIFRYLVAEYTANLTLTKYYWVQQFEFVNTVRKYMSNNNMPMQLQNRVLYNLNSVMDIFEDKRKISLYKDCPGHFYKLVQINKYSSIVRNIQLFKDLNEDVINMLAIKCTELRLPPEEYVVYSGELSGNIYYIKKGYCRIVEGKVSQKVLGPHSVINAIETVLGIDSLLTIRAQTFTTLITLKNKHLDLVFATHPGIKEDIKACMSEMTMKRGFTRDGDYVSGSFDVSEHTMSWFNFPRARRNPLNIDYKNVYAVTNWRILRYVLMRQTVLPNGNFLKYWEIFRALCAVLLGFIGPASSVCMYYFPWITYVSWFLYLIGFVDMYIRLHECYYNSKGILVTHPLYTAKYYIAHGLFIDALGLMPFFFVVNMLVEIQRPKICMALKFNVLLQLYRFAHAFSWKKKNAYHIESVFSRALKCIPLSFVMFNAFACATMLLSGDVKVKNGKELLVQRNFSFITLNRKHINFDTNEFYNFYIVSLYWVITSALALGFTQLHPVTSYEMIMKIITIIFGYIFVMHNLVFIAHSRFIVNQNLTMFQNSLTHLINYMKTENVSKRIQNETVKYFEHKWRMTHGVQSNTIADMFHLPLKTDFVLQLYESTLQNVPAFKDCSKSFFRLIGTRMKETYLRKNVAIISLNDIVDTIYIVHKGDVTVYGPAKTHFAVLGNGSMFGNIDNIECTRSMVTVVTNSTTDLLKIDTKLFHTLVEPFPIITARIQRHILLENLSYMKSSVPSDESIDVEFVDNTRELNPLMKVFLQRYFYMIMVIISFASCWVASYQVAFSDLRRLYYALYFFDVMHILKVLINLHTPFYNKRGDLITDRRLIRRRYMVPTKFYLDCLTIFPYEVLSLLIKEENRENYRMIIGSYRILRALNVYQFFDVYENKLNTSALIVRIWAILTHTLIFVHLAACLAYIYTCPLYKCNTDNWTFSRQNISRCNDGYVCSIYYVMSIFTSAGFNTHYPRTRIDMLFSIFILVLSKYIIAVFFGDMTALIMNSTYSLAQYNSQMEIFKAGINNCFISGPFYKKLIRYFNNLWVARMGRQSPDLLLEAPHFLVEDINIAMYGQHIYNNLVFAHCHKDFLRALMRMLQVRTFFLGDTICYQEDVNDTMYFIHKGIVDVYTILENQEFHVDQLCELDSFGMVQGLYPRTPHTHTYKSNSVTVVLLLRFDDWQSLLSFFPASKFEIYKNMAMLDKL